MIPEDCGWENHVLNLFPNLEGKRDDDNNKSALIHLPGAGPAPSVE